MGPFVFPLSEGYECVFIPDYTLHTERDNCALVNRVVKKADYIIAGGGCAGLSLGYALASKSNEHISILIIDRDEKDSNDRTWCFWSKTFPFINSLAFHSWTKLSFGSDHGLKTYSISPYRYYMVRSGAWYDYMKSKMRGTGKVSFLKAPIDRIGEDGIGPYAVIKGEKIRSKCIINTCFAVPPLKQQWPVYHLWQHFKGWWIETDDPVFDPEQGRLMDFRTDQDGDSRFFYVLPVSERRALVEYTIFSETTLNEGAYDRPFEKYMKAQFPNITYKVLETEQGKIPMTNQKYPRYSSPNVLNIGTVGGVVKPTTGYAFLRIQNESQYIAQKLIQGERVVDPKRSASRFAFYDRLLLHILQHHGEMGKGIFSSLFRTNPMPRILTFLNEKSRLHQEMLIFSKLPKMPFLRALGVQLATQFIQQFSAPSSKESPDKSKSQSKKKLVSVQ